MLNENLLGWVGPILALAVAVVWLYEKVTRVKLRRVDPGYEWISPDARLPPTECPLVLNRDGTIVRAERIDHIESRDRQMNYLLSTGETIVGRFPWTYP